MYIIGASTTNMPPKDMLNHAETEEERQDLMKQEANLLSVAMTRQTNCVDYILLIDSWTDQAAIDAHHASPMMAQLTALREKYDLHMIVERFVSD